MITQNKPVVTIIGRPNVGKSTLFNTLISQPKAIISEQAGTTRNVVKALCQWQGKEFELIDTGGLRTKTADDIETSVQKQSQLAADQADIIILVTDIRSGPTTQEIEVAHALQKTSQSVLLAVNKAEGKRGQDNVPAFHNLGLGKPYLVSAIQGTGTGDLLDAVVDRLDSQKSVPIESKEEIKVGIFGKPNVGKSSILNALLGEPRAIVSEIPGTTRDTMDTKFVLKDYDLILVDTAGIKRRVKTKAKIDQLSMIRSLKTIKEVDVAIFVIDADQDISKQDLRIASEITDREKGVLILINKWDLILADSDKDEKEEIAEFVRYYQHHLSFLYWAPILFTSAINGKNIDHIIGLVKKIYRERKKIIPAEDLQEFLAKTIEKNPPPSHRQKKRPEIKDLKQVSTNPPRFTMKVKGRVPIKRPYLKYLEKEMRREFGFEGIPIAIKIVKDQ